MPTSFEIPVKTESPPLPPHDNIPGNSSSRNPENMDAPSTSYGYDFPLSSNDHGAQSGPDVPSAKHRSWPVLTAANLPQNSEGKVIPTCHHCLRTFTVRHSLKMHLGNKVCLSGDGIVFPRKPRRSWPALREENLPRDTEGKVTPTCHLCRQVFKSKQGLRQHIGNQVCITSEESIDTEVKSCLNAVVQQVVESIEPNSAHSVNKDKLQGTEWRPGKMDINNLSTLGEDSEKENVSPSRSNLPSTSSGPNAQAIGVIKPRILTETSSRPAEHVLRYLPPVTKPKRIWPALTEANLPRDSEGKVMATCHLCSQTFTTRQGVKLHLGNKVCERKRQQEEEDRKILKYLEEKYGQSSPTTGSDTSQNGNSSSSSSSEEYASAAENNGSSPDGNIFANSPSKNGNGSSSLSANVQSSDDSLASSSSSQSSSSPDESESVESGSINSDGNLSMGNSSSNSRGYVKTANNSPGNLFWSLLKTRQEHSDGTDWINDGNARSGQSDSSPPHDKLYNSAFSSKPIRLEYDEGTNWIDDDNSYAIDDEILYEEKLRLGESDEENDVNGNEREVTNWMNDGLLQHRKYQEVTTAGEKSPQTQSKDFATSQAEFQLRLGNESSSDDGELLVDYLSGSRVGNQQAGRNGESSTQIKEKTRSPRSEQSKEVGLLPAEKSYEILPDFWTRRKSVPDVIKDDFISSQKKFNISDDQMDEFFGPLPLRKLFTESFEDDLSAKEHGESTYDPSAELVSEENIEEPVSAGNNTVEYEADVKDNLGVSKDDNEKNLITDTNQSFLAEADQPDPLAADSMSTVEPNVHGQKADSYESLSEHSSTFDPLPDIKQDNNAQHLGSKDEYESPNQSCVADDNSLNEEFYKTADSKFLSDDSSEDDLFVQNMRRASQVTPSMKQPLNDSSSSDENTQEINEYKTEERTKEEGAVNEHVTNIGTSSEEGSKRTTTEEHVPSEESENANTSNTAEVADVVENSSSMEEEQGQTADNELAPDKSNDGNIFMQGTKSAEPDNNQVDFQEVNGKEQATNSVTQSLEIQNSPQQRSHGDSVDANQASEINEDSATKDEAADIVENGTNENGTENAAKENTEASDKKLSGKRQIEKENTHQMNKLHSPKRAKLDPIPEGRISSPRLLLHTPPKGILTPHNEVSSPSKKIITPRKTKLKRRKGKNEANKSLENVIQEMHEKTSWRQNRKYSPDDSSIPSPEIRVCVEKLSQSNQVKGLRLTNKGGEPTSRKETSSTDSIPLESNTVDNINIKIREFPSPEVTVRIEKPSQSSLNRKDRKAVPDKLEGKKTMTPGGKVRKSKGKTGSKSEPGFLRNSAGIPSPEVRVQLQKLSSDNPLIKLSEKACIPQKTEPTTRRGRPKKNPVNKYKNSSHRDPVQNKMDNSSPMRLSIPSRNDISIPSPEIRVHVEKLSYPYNVDKNTEKPSNVKKMVTSPGNKVDIPKTEGHNVNNAGNKKGIPCPEIRVNLKPLRVRTVPVPPNDEIQVEMKSVLGKPRKGRKRNAKQNGGI